MSSQPTAEDAAAASSVNTITWTEIPATDLIRISTFYSTVFGWTCKAFPASTASDPHFMLFNHGSMSGGFAKVTPENHLSPAKLPNNAAKEKRTINVAIHVESIEQTLEAIEKAGGALYHPKKEIPEGMGFVAHFTDSEENILALWASK